ncbi:hypothetical protein [Thermomonospora cellulosilytica]|uniref:Uncharacterized protein n=1 Tax=Thermomonospora cellulosilytica TaxID=1411118 RepID=A0A7W3R8S2_9ACTN|nr:hypothetical protein [Thermomonospora cellulosilytica]MBA9003600.1 hypothetical protein [Thermomonospora cellulosilytica]
MKPLAEATGHVAAPIADVRRRLLELLEGARTEDGLIVVQGGWWYRAEYHLSPGDQGTRVTLLVFNAATTARWAVPLANRFFVGFQAEVHDGFQKLLHTLNP